MKFTPELPAEGIAVRTRGDGWVGADGFIPVITMRGRGFAANAGGTAERDGASPLVRGAFFMRYSAVHG